MEIEKCPYHNVQPEYKEIVFREKTEKKYIDSSGNEKYVIFPKLASHYWFCPVCAVEPHKGPASAKLAAGYYSQDSKIKALENWNAGIARLLPAIIRTAVKGRDA